MKTATYALIFYVQKEYIEEQNRNVQNNVLIIYLNFITI